MTNPEEDVNRLLNEGIRSAKYLLEHGGSRIPFAFTIRASGEMKMASALPPGTAEGKVDPEEARQMLLEILKEQVRRGDIRAAVVCSDGFVETADREWTDAIVVRIEHADAGLYLLYLPYRKRFFRWHYGELRRREGNPPIFLA